MAGTKGFRYVYGSKQITNVLEKIKNAGRPDKLNFAYFRDTWLFKNAQYGAVLDILVDMEFLDNSGTPTELYAECQNPVIAKRAIAKGIINAYPELFKAYPKAYSHPKKDLEGYFKQQTGKTGSTIGMMLTTFNTLCGEADFSDTNITEIKTTENVTAKDSKYSPRIKVEPNVQINIEIHIAHDTPDDKIETIFKKMRQYLLSNE